MSVTLLDPPSTNGAANTDIQAIFKEKFLHVSLKPHRPELTVRLTAERLARYQVALSTVINDGVVEEESQQSLENQIQLLLKPQRKMLNVAYKKVDDFFKDPAMTREYPLIEGLRVLPLARRQLFFDTWPAVQRRFKEDLEQFFTIYPTEVVVRNRDKWLPKLGAHFWAEIERRHLPPLSTLRTKFSVHITSGTFSHSDAKDFEEAVEFLAKSVRTQLQSALDNLKLQLTDGKKLSLATLNELRSALTAVRSFADLSDSKMLKQSNELTSVLDDITKDVTENYKSTGALTLTALLRGHSGTLTGAMDTMLSAVKNQQGINSVMARFGRPPD